MRSTHLLLAVATLAVTGCGLLPWGDGGEGQESLGVVADTVPAVVADSASVSPSGAAITPDTVTDGPPAGPQGSEALQGGTPAASPDQPPPVPQDSLGAVLRELVDGQAALNARLDSMDGRLGIGVDSAAAPDSAAVAGRAGQVIGEAGQHVRSFGVGIVLSILVIILFNLVIRGFTWVLDTLSERSVTRRLFYKRLVPVVRIVLWVFAAYLIIRVIFQVRAEGILAAAAAVGVAVGFAAQDLLKNLFGGIILVFDQPFQVGDKISVGGTYGEVVSIGLRSTRIVTPDDNLVSVPNAQVVDDQVANANAGELNCQVVTDLFLPGFIDESRAKKIAFDAAVSSKYVFLNKPIVVLVKDDFKETFLTRIRVKAYVLDPRHEFLFQSDVTERARAGFRDAGLMEAEHGLRAYLDLSKVSAPGDEADG